MSVSPWFALLVSILLFVPYPAAAQSSQGVPVIGYLGNSPPSTAGAARVRDALVDELRRQGYVDGQTVRIEWRWSEGRAERFPYLARDLVERKVNVIVAAGSQATQAAKDATRAIPIVLALVSHPVEAGFVASLARPGGNITGVTNQLGDLNFKIVQLMKEIVPGARRLGILWNPEDLGSALAFKEAQEQFPALGLNVISVPVRNPDEFDAAFAALLRDRPDFLNVHPSPIVFRNRQRVADFATRHRLPTSTGDQAMAVDGSILMSYGPDFADLMQRAAALAAKILRGAKPADLPQATHDLIAQLELRPETHVLDIGSGLGGPARHMTVATGCRVTRIDLTEEYVTVANSLS
jgi:putative ABC transport system substrate-binding protein